MPMPRLRAITLAGLLACSPASAALAPPYQRLAELNAILADARVIAALKAPIDSIEYRGVDRYRVTAGPCRLDVAIVGKPPVNGMVGPRQFTVEPSKPVCS